MSLRNFSALSKSAGASIYGYACNLTNMDGTLVTGTAPLYLQIHDKATAPVADDVPIESYEILTSGPFPLASVFQSLSPIVLANGLAVGISTVNQKYTAATATYSVLGQIEEGQQSIDGISGLTLVGPVTFASASAIWTRASGPKRLFSLSVVNGAGAILYPMLFEVDVTPVDGAIPTQELPAIASGATKNYYFGLEGYKDQNLFGLSKGCYLVLSSTGKVLTTDLVASNTITAYYKT